MIIYLIAYTTISVTIFIGLCIYVMYQTKELYNALIISLFHIFIIPMLILFKVKDIICKKLFDKLKHKYWFCRIYTLEGIFSYKQDKESGIRMYCTQKLKNRGIAPFSTDGYKLYHRFYKRYFGSKE